MTNILTPNQLKYDFHILYQPRGNGCGGSGTYFYGTTAEILEYYDKVEYLEIWGNHTTAKLAEAQCKREIREDYSKAAEYNYTIWADYKSLSQILADEQQFEKDKENLNTCNTCGSQDIYIHGPSRDGDYWAMCGKCQTMGSVSKNKLTVKDGWNSCNPR